VIEASAIADCVPLPAAPDGWFDYGYTALDDGHLALLRTQRNIHREYRRYRETFEGGFPTIAPPKVWPDRLRLSVFDGKEESDVVIVPSGWHPKVDRMREGQWIVASSRAGPAERNGRIYSPDGKELAAIVPGRRDRVTALRARRVDLGRLFRRRITVTVHLSSNRAKQPLTKLALIPPATPAAGTHDKAC
jgi:hypothetical protein